jgi:hypothetical protein
VLTKSLSRVKFEHFRDKLGIVRKGTLPERGSIYDSLLLTSLLDVKQDDSLLLTSLLDVKQDDVCVPCF